MSRPQSSNARRTPERAPCYVAPLAQPRDRSRPRAHAHLGVTGLACAHCATRVHNALLALEGVLAANVDAKAQRALVTYDPTRTLPDHLTDAVHRAGLASRHRYHATITRIDTQEPT